MTDDAEGFDETFDPEAAAERFAFLNKTNSDGIATLNGRGAPLNPLDVFARRLELVVDALFGPWGESAERLAFEVAWQERLQALVGQGLNETVGQSIIVPKNGTAGTNGLHLP